MCLTDLKKYSNIKSHDNPSSESHILPSRWTDMTKLMVAFCNFANMPKNLLEYKDVDEAIL